jgi:cell division protein FtsB
MLFNKHGRFQFQREDLKEKVRVLSDENHSLRKQVDTLKKDKQSQEKKVGFTKISTSLLFIKL